MDFSKGPFLKGNENSSIRKCSSGFVGLKNGKKCIENQTSIQKLSITLFSIHFEKSAPAVYKAGKWDCKLKN